MNPRLNRALIAILLLSVGVRVAVALYLGDIVDYRIGVGDWILRAHTGTDVVLKPDQQVFLAISPDQITLIAV